MEATYIPVNFDNIPTELQDKHNFVLWRFNNDGTKSPPLNPHNGELAYVNDPGTWGTFTQARDRLYKGRTIGIGFVLAKDSGIVSIDIDHCVTRGYDLTDNAETIVDSIDSYSEYSPSGKGVHIWLFGEKPGDRQRGSFEVYDSNRYLTLTGYRLPGTPRNLQHRQEQLDALYHAEFPTRPVATAVQHGGYRVRSDAGVIDAMSRAKNANRSMPLWDGDTSGYRGASEADFQLAKFLMWFSYGNVEQVDRLFRMSGLMRDKWDEKRGSTTYGELTLNNAFRAWQQNQA